MFPHYSFVNRNRNPRPVILCVIALLSVSGCATSSTTNTARSSVEQLLIANAIDQSLDKCDFKSFSGQQVFLQDKYVDCVDKNYVIASTRHRLLAAGASLVDAPDQADVVVELRSGAVGTTASNSYLGTPEIALPGMMTIPEVKVMERRRQMAVAKLGLVAYDPKTNTILGSGGTSLAKASDNNWFVAGIGPYQNGSVRSEISRSTTGPAAKPKTSLPVTVAFEPPKSTRSMPEGTQLATGESEPSEVSPASHVEKVEKSSTPVWAQ